MSAHTHVATHAAKAAGEVIRDLAPLHAPKSVFLAAVLGVAFGPLGVAIYFKSAKDFFICLGMLIFFSFLIFFGPGEILGWLFSGAYGAWRAHTSNEKHGAGSSLVSN